MVIIFLKQLFLSAFVFCGFVSNGYADVLDIAPLGHLEKETPVVQCCNRKTPDEECKSYVVTPTNKICLSSAVTTQANTKEPDNTAIKEKSLHEEANAEDAQNLQESISNLNSNIEPIDEIDIKEPIMKK